MSYAQPYNGAAEYRVGARNVSEITRLWEVWSSGYVRSRLLVVRNHQPFHLTAKIRIMSDPRKLVESAFESLNENIQFMDSTNPSVSAWSVGMQIHHTLLAANVILETLNSSEPGARTQERSLMRSAILKVGRIPRGKGKSPDGGMPSKDITAQELRQLYATAMQKLAATETTDPTAWWDHHMFGVMTLDTALSFLNVHTRHHLALIDDIRKS